MTIPPLNTPAGSAIYCAMLETFKETFERIWCRHGVSEVFLGLLRDLGPDDMSDIEDALDDFGAAIMGLPESGPLFVLVCEMTPSTFVGDLIRACGGDA